MVARVAFGVKMGKLAPCNFEFVGNIDFFLVFMVFFVNLKLKMRFRAKVKKMKISTGCFLKEMKRFGKESVLRDGVKNKKNKLMEFSK
jgi:hypothetical protein